MANEVKQPTATPDKTSEEKVVKAAKQAWNKSGKMITYALVAVVLIVGGYFAYNQLVKKPEDLKAGTAMWKAQEYFKIDSFSLALNGDGTHQGFLRIINNYGGTPSGNLARFYAGACYLQLGDFNNAVKYLKDFSTSSKPIQVRHNGLLGDAYSELGKKQEAVDQYKKAGTVFPEDNINAPEYLFRAALLQKDLGKTKEAIETLHLIRDKYPMSPRGFEVEKVLAKMGDTK